MVSMYQQGEKNGRQMQKAEGSRQKAEGARRLLSAFCFLPFLLASALRTRLVLLVELRVPAGERYVASVDEHVLDLSPYLERVTVSDNQVCNLPLLDRSDAIGDAENLRRINRDRLERFFFWQPKRGSHSGVT